VIIVVFVFNVGQRCGRVVISQWFVELRGRAQGVAAVGLSLGLMGVFPSVATSLRDSVGWRVAYLYFSLFTGLIIAPLALLLLRDQPEKYGLLPDGKSSARETGDLATVNLISHERSDDSDSESDDVASVVELIGADSGSSDGSMDSDPEGLALEDLSDSDSSSNSPAIEGVTWREAVRNPLFFLINAATGASACIGTAFFFYMPAILEERGNTEEWLPFMIYLAVACLAAVFNVGAGWILDRVGKRVERVVAVNALILSASVLVLAFPSRSVATVVLFALLFGVHNGTSQVVGATVFATLFGRRHLGSITGLVTSFMVACTAVGPLLFSGLQALTGSFGLAFGVSIVWPLSASMMLFWWSRRKPPVDAGTAFE
jgi:MFS family permease